MFLLELNGGLGATDLSAMAVAVLDPDNVVLDYDHIKTGSRTVWPKLKPGFDAHVFLTRCGIPFWRIPTGGVPP